MIIDAINCNNANVSHKGKNRHSEYNTDEKDEGLDLEYLKPDLKSKIKQELEKSHREQLILLKENKQNIIDFLIDNKESIRVEDLKIYEPVYKCHRQKDNCFYCNTTTNIICKNSNSHEDVWLCTNHWKQHTIENH